MKKYICLIMLILCCFVVTQAFPNSGEDGEKEDECGSVRLNGGKAVDLGEVTLKELRNGISKPITFEAYSTTNDAGSYRTVNLVDASNARYVKSMTSLFPLFPETIYNSACYKRWKSVNIGSITIGIGKDETPQPGEHTVSPVTAEYTLVDASSGRSQSAALSCSYRFTLKESSFDVKSLGNVITNVSDNNVLSSSRGVLSEAEIYNNFRSREECQFQKLAADGESRLLITVVTDNEDDEITFTADSAAVAQKIEFYTLRGTRFSNSGRLASDYLFDKVSSSPEKYQCTIVMKAPDGVYARDGEREVPFSVTFRNQYNKSVTKNFSLCRTPVVLIHGLWGHATDFRATMSSLESAGYYTFVNEYDNWKGPSEILPTYSLSFLHGFLLPALNYLKFMGIECKKIDVVGHSMGGLLTKQFTRNRYYKTEYTYGKRAVRRLITLGTPHWGSPLANLLNEDTKYFKKRPPLFFARRIAALRAMLNGLDHKCGSCHDDLQLFSPLILNLNFKNYDLPMYALAGNAGRHLIFPFLREIPYIGDITNYYLGGYGHNDIFFNVTGLFGLLTNPSYTPNYIAENSDTVVGLSSALWSGVMGNATTIVDGGAIHMNMGKDKVMAAHVLALLAADASVFKIPNASSSYNRASSSFAQTKNYASDSSSNAPSSHQRLKSAGAASAASDAGTDFEHIALESDAERTLTVNSTVKFTAVPDGVVSGDLTLVNLDIGCFEMASADGKYTCSLSVSEDFIGREQKFLVIGCVDGELALSNAVGVFVKPQRQPVSLDITNGPDLFIVKGDTQRVNVIASYPDGSSYCLDGSAFGTEFYSGNSNIAAVDGDGVITAVNVGSADMYIVNSGLIKDITVHVVDGTVTAPADVSSDITVRVQTRLEGRGSSSDIAAPNANNRERMTVALYSVSGDSIYADMTVSTDEYGVASFDVPPSVLHGHKNVQIWAKGDRYLAVLESHDITIENDTCLIALDQLCRGGDANNDNIVNTKDFLILRESLSKPVSDPACDARADFNADAWVHARDFIILRKNLSRRGDERPNASSNNIFAARSSAVNHSDVRPGDTGRSGCSAVGGLSVITLAALFALKRKERVRNSSPKGGDKNA